MRHLTFSALLLATALAGCATKAPAPVAPTQADWDAVSTVDFTCERDPVLTASFESVVAAPQAYFGKCLRLRALFDGKALYRDAHSLKALHSRGHEFDGIIGVTAKDQKTTGGFAAHPQFVGIEGRLVSCAARNRAYADLTARANAAGQSVIPFVLPGGHCHDSDGPVLYTVRIDTIPTAMD